MLNHSRSIIGAVAAAAMVAMAGPATAETKLTIMVFQGMQNLPLFAAQHQGLFAKRDLVVDVKIAPTSEELRNGLAEGRYQLVHAAIDNAVAMADVAQVDIAVFIGGDNSMNHLFVQPEIKSLAEIRGKTVLVDAPNTAYAFQLYEMLRQNGLNKGDYSIGEAGATFKRLDGMQKDKSAAAAMLNPPFSLRAEKAGLKDMGTAAKALGAYQGTSGFVLRSWAKANEDTLVKYIGAYIEGLRWALDPANKAEAVKLYVDGLKVPEDIALGCYDAAMEGLAKDARLDLEGFKNVLALRARFEGGTPAAPEKYLDVSYYQKAIAGL